MTRDLVVGLDLATQTGWAVYDLSGNLLDSGVWDLSSRSKGEHEGWRWNRLNQRLTELLRRYGARVAVIGVEGAFSSPTQQGGKSGMSKRSTAVLWGLRAIVESVAALHREPDGIPIAVYAQSTVKKHYAGHGHAPIGEVIAVAEKERRLKTPDTGTSNSLKLRSDEAVARGVAKTVIATNRRAHLRLGRLTPSRAKR